eukprot:3927441-Pyramimonas_sp.AAC.1
MATMASSSALFLSAPSHHCLRAQPTSTRLAVCAPRRIAGTVKHNGRVALSRKEAAPIKASAQNSPFTGTNASPRMVSVGSRTGPMRKARMAALTACGVALGVLMKPIALLSLIGGGNGGGDAP